MRAKNTELENKNTKLENKNTELENKNTKLENKNTELEDEIKRLLFDQKERDRRHQEELEDASRYDEDSYCRNCGKSSCRCWD